MSDNGFASLSSSLLARKGGAKPAMRPQNTAGITDGKTAAANLEDLGWDDMGDEEPRHSGQVLRISPAIDHTSVPTSPVKASIAEIAAKLEAPVRTNPPAPAQRKRENRRAAFTLRLDQERHLKLRLACTVRGRSAQQLVTDALDQLLAQMPEIETLAAHVLRD